MYQAQFHTGSTAQMPPASPHPQGDEAGVLDRIGDDGVNLSLWRRAPQPRITREVAGLQAGSLPDIRCRTTPASFDEDLRALLAQRGLDSEKFPHWCADMALLAARYFRVGDGRKVTLRLVTTNDDDCRRFHVDRTNLRLLCTYRGPGTEWLSDAQVDRAAQANGAPNEGIIRFGEPLRFEPFWVGVMKGDAYPGNAGHGLVHRSPAIAGSGQTRVLFCLDS